MHIQKFIYLFKIYCKNEIKLIQNLTFRLLRTGGSRFFCLFVFLLFLFNLKLAQTLKLSQSDDDDVYGEQFYLLVLAFLQYF